MGSRSRSLLAGVLLLALTGNPAAAAENLGRLFFTPQQRQDLDRRRQANIQESAVTVNSSVTVNGQVSRSRGKTTVWINGVPQESTRRPLDPARVSLPSGQGESESSVTVKIGQTLDKVRGQVKDPIEGGKILTPSEKRTPRP
jgi:molybdopterin-biosynthesis enzyme MoeA-like protein